MAGPAKPSGGDALGLYSLTLGRHRREICLDSLDHIFLGLKVGGVVGAAHQRSAGDVAEALREGDFLPFIEFFRCDVVHYRKMHLGRTKILPQSQDGDVSRP